MCALQFIPSLGISALSQAVVANGFVFTFSQVGRDADGRLPDSFAEHLDQPFQNLQVMLTQAGSSLSSVVKITTYITSAGCGLTFNEVYARYFRLPFPARTRVEVSRLVPGHLIELDVVVVIRPDAAHAQSEE